MLRVKTQIIVLETLQKRNKVSPKFGFIKLDRGSECVSGTTCGYSWEEQTHAHFHAPFWHPWKIGVQGWVAKKPCWHQMIRASILLLEVWVNRDQYLELLDRGPLGVVKNLSSICANLFCLSYFWAIGTLGIGGKRRVRQIRVVHDGFACL